MDDGMEHIAKHKIFPTTMKTHMSKAFYHRHSFISEV